MAGALQAVEDPRSWTSRSVREVRLHRVERELRGGLEGGVAVFEGGGCSVQGWWLAVGSVGPARTAAAGRWSTWWILLLNGIGVARAEHLDIGRAAVGGHGELWRCEVCWHCSAGGTATAAGAAGRVEGVLLPDFVF